MIEEKSWEDFRKSGLLWWVNRTLHLFGWAICIEIEETTSKVSRAYPARCKFRGFSEDCEEKGFKDLTEFINDNSEDLMKDL